MDFKKGTLREKTASGYVPVFLKTSATQVDGLDIVDKTDSTEKTKFASANSVRLAKEEAIAAIPETYDAEQVAYSNPDLPGVTNAKQALDSYNENIMQAWNKTNLPIEEGVFSPSLGGSVSDGSVTLPPKSGRYYKIGKLVIIHVVLTGISIVTAPTGNLRIKNLPFSADTTYYGAPISFITGVPLIAGATSINVSLLTSAQAELYWLITNGTDVSMATVPASGIKSNLDLRFSAVYKVA